jgi:selenocysteine lyase/cysteine desulfurase
MYFANGRAKLNKADQSWLEKLKQMVTRRLREQVRHMSLDVTEGSRKDFPIFERTIRDGKEFVYLDSGSN